MNRAGGKTHAVIELVQQVASQHPLQRIWVVLPTSRQRAAFRDRLLQTIKSHPAPTFNVEPFQFPHPDAPRPQFDRRTGAQPDTRRAPAPPAPDRSAYPAQRAR
ncbi:MAG: hypothetical protein HND48_14605 [Chloroflexi bacterium]|nr:hypothetical protein [Chloroflexota bacterium]